MPDPQSDALPNWQMNNQHQSYESASYEAASSLPALSLIIADTPTAPPRSELQPRKTARLEAEQEQSIADMPTTPMRPEQRQQQSRKTARLEAEQEQIAEIDTLPPDLVAQITPRRMARAESHSSSENKRRSASGQSKPPVRTNRSVQPALAGIDEFDTLPPLNGTPVRPAETARELRTARTSRSASRQAFSSSQQSYRHVPAPRKGFHPLDSLRWWLLRPGHIEFLLWVTGSLLLFSITFFLLLATTLSVLMPNTASSGNLHNSSISSTATAQSTSGQSLTPQATHAQAQTPVSTPQAGSPGVRTTPVPGNTPALGNALNTTTDNSLIDRLLHLNPLIWLVAACYLLSLILLILAVRLRRRKSPSKIASENRVGR
jgi:hypothetical protein